MSLAPEFDLLINGSPVSAEVLGFVETVVVDDSLGLPSMFAFTVTSSDVQGQDLPWVDDGQLFSIGNVVEIKMGEAGATKSLIIGEITALEPEFVICRLPLLNVRGYDRRHRMQRGRNTRTFLNQRDDQIAVRFARDAGMHAQVTETDIVHEYLLQASQTDWEFLCERARLIGYEVGVVDNTLFFQPVGNAQSAILTLDMSNGLLEFYPQLSVAGQATEVKVQSWSVKDKKGLLGESMVGDEVSTMGGKSSGAAIAQSAFGAAVDVISDVPVGAQAEVDQIALARFNELVLELIIGEGLCRGRTDIRAGKVIKIDGVGRRFGGPYFVTSAVHRYSSDDGYVTEFLVRRNAS
jgi:phage protein D